MSEEISIDGLEEHAFRRSIESMLRHGRADEAAERLRTLLPEIAGPGKILPARLIEITTADLTFSGWETIASKLDEYSRDGAPITAIGIGICDPEDSGIEPNEEGHLRPPLETTYYSDATFPFSETDRDDLLEGYSSYGCEWQGDYDRADHTLSLEGIDDLYGAIASLENKVANSENPSAADIRAGAIGACYLGVLVYMAARDTVVKMRLPRPLAVLLVNSDAYPFFDAPVMTCDEYLDDGEVKVVEQVRSMALAGDGFDYDTEELDDSGSLLSMGSLVRSGTTKKMALALEGEEAANPLGMADELVAQAAFDPDSVDTSRYMPQITEPPFGFEEQDDAFDEDADPDSGEFAEIEFPVESKLNFGTPSEESSDEQPVNLPVPPANPYLDTSRESRNSGYADFEDEEDLAAPFSRRVERVEIELNSPTLGEESQTESANFEDAADSADSHVPEETYSAWTDPDAGLPYMPPAQSAPHAMHSIRSKIRGPAPAESGPSLFAKLAEAIGQLIKRVQDMLSRR